MAGRSLVDLRKLQRNQLKFIIKVELIEAILSTGGDDSEAAAQLEDCLLSIANELVGLKLVLTNSETDLDKKFLEM